MPIPRIFMRLGAPPAHGGLLRNAFHQRNDRLKVMDVDLDLDVDVDRLLRGKHWIMKHLAVEAE